MTVNMNQTISPHKRKQKKNYDINIDANKIRKLL